MSLPNTRSSRGCRDCDSLTASNDHDRAYERWLCPEFQSSAAVEFTWREEELAVPARL